MLDNGGYGAVAASVLGMYPNGYAAKSDEVPLTGLTPSPAFALVAKASRAHAETMTDTSDFDAALARAIAVVTDERRQALLDVRIVD